MEGFTGFSKGFSLYCYESDNSAITFHYDGKKSARDVHGRLGSRRIEKVTFDTSITTIGENAFWACTNLTTIELSSYITEIEHSAFSHCKSLITIGFSSCHSLTSIKIPSSVTKIGKEAFSECINLQKVSISPSTTIEKDAFAHCPKLNEQSLINISHCFLNVKIQETFQNKLAPNPKYEFKGSTQYGWGPEQW